MNTKNILALASLAMLAVSAAPAFAHDGDGNFERNHPRRDQVLDRDQNLNRRINNEKGDLGGHYNQLKNEDRAIRREEQRDARENGGHITRREQERINHQENHLSKQIRRDER